MGAIAVFLLLLGACAPASLKPPSLPLNRSCQASAEDRDWLGGALAAWRATFRGLLQAPDRPLPQIVAYDSACAYTLAPSPGTGARWSAVAHRGQVALPNGTTIPVGPNAFNAVTGAGANFVVIALPSIWRPVAPKSEIPLLWFLEGVFLHELAHSYQADVTPALSFPALLKRLPADAAISDDSVQEQFEKDPAYAGDLQAELDLLFRAASAPSRAEAQSLACDGLAALRSRRARHFAGANAHWALVDEVSLTTEGLGQWVAYAWLSENRRLDRNLVIAKLRSRYWSQEQGLAVFLVVDRLVPDWQRRLFSRSPETAERLLKLACGR